VSSGRGGKPPEDAFPPDRKVGRGLRVNSGWFASDKAGRMIPWEGPLAFDWLHVHEVDPEVVRVYPETRTFRYAHRPGSPTDVVLLDTDEPAPAGYVATTYTPDQFVRRHDGDVLMEIKPFARLLDERSRRQVAAGMAYAAKHARDGVRFAVGTDVIHHDGRLDNALGLLRFRGERVPDVWRAQAVRVLLRARQTTVGRLIRDVGLAPYEAWGWCCALVCAGVVGCDLGQPLSHDTRLWLRAPAP
jgi:hypothetical protein